MELNNKSILLANGPLLMIEKLQILFVIIKTNININKQKKKPTEAFLYFIFLMKNEHK
jgi:hypothetical protein